MRWSSTGGLLKIFDGGFGKTMYSKYGNVKTVSHGKKMDSKKEARRYDELLFLEKAGKITKLKRQVPFVLIPSQYADGKCVERSVKYIADFVYWRDGEMVVEDAKGFKTPEYIIKRKLMLKVFGIRIKEV